MDDELARVLKTLTARRADLAARLEVLDRMIADARRLAGTGVHSNGHATSPESGDDARRRRAPKGHGVRQQVVALLNERGGTWSVTDVIGEFARRGEPLQVHDPMNTVRSALSRAAQDGELVRAEPGKYTVPPEGGTSPPSAEDERQEAPD